MIFEQVLIGPMQNFGYVIGDENSKEGAIVDPGWNADKLIGAAKHHRLTVKKIILTHAHFDHVKALQEVYEKTTAEIVLHEDEPYEPDFENSTVTRVKDNHIVKIGALKCRIVHTPGHTPGSICLLLGSKMITGDTLFVGGCGRVDLPGSNPQQMWTSLQKLRKMDDTLEIYPGHDYGETPSSTMEHEKKHNPFLASATKKEFFTSRL